MMIAGLLSLVLARAEPTSPAAGPTTPVVLTPIEYEGELVEAFRDRIEAQMRAGLERSEYTVLDAEAAAGVPAYRVHARLGVDDRNYRLQLSVEDAHGVSVAQIDRTCELCGIQDVAEMVANEAAALAGDLGARVRALPLLTIESQPSGATIELDGRAAGQTPASLRVPVGRHRARAQLSGHFDQEVEIDAFAGLNQTIALRLVPRPVPPTPEQRRRAAMGPVGAVVLVLGGGALASGAVLLALDERPLRSQCSGADIDAFGNCRQLYDTLAGGVALTVTGAISAAVGSALLGLAYGKRHPRHRGARR